MISVEKKQTFVDKHGPKVMYHILRLSEYIIPKRAISMVETEPMTYQKDLILCHNKVYNQNFSLCMNQTDGSRLRNAMHQ